MYVRWLEVSACKASCGLHLVSKSKGSEAWGCSGRLRELHSIPKGFLEYVDDLSQYPLRSVYGNVII